MRKGAVEILEGERGRQRHRDRERERDQQLLRLGIEINRQKDVKGVCVCVSGVCECACSFATNVGTVLFRTRSLSKSGGLSFCYSSTNGTHRHSPVMKYYSMTCCLPCGHTHSCAHAHMHTLDHVTMIPLEV